LLAVFLIVLTIQNYNSEKNARVSFSYQVEHLANLDLIQKDDSKKVALNDNLVTFSGVFKDKISDEAKARF
jgi:cell division protease FtsH